MISISASAWEVYSFISGLSVCLSVNGPVALRPAAVDRAAVDWTGLVWSGVTAQVQVRDLARLPCNCPGTTTRNFPQNGHKGVHVLLFELVSELPVENQSVHQTVRCPRHRMSTITMSSLLSMPAGNKKKRKEKRRQEEGGKKETREGKREKKEEKKRNHHVTIYNKSTTSSHLQPVSHHQPTSNRIK
ncbi:hypothetical protein BD289DRAFT_447350 [Coniella lustricola]|uniref:Uncharacterized protein n=1 Tax=Coniella lustricola TaxID=2025994 RepID=A0A2T2ZT74_9PEZI|nr:hypothetical protein BD289DRAFT_447350 [Coniella lustricola]